MRKCLAWMMVVLAPGLGACKAGSSQLPGGEGLDLVPEQFEFLPVPKDFQLHTDVNQSWTFRKGRFRTGNLEYSGSGSLEAHRQFLKEQLSVQGWENLEENRPLRNLVRQKWTFRMVDGVIYTLNAELSALGPRVLLRYELSTKKFPRAHPTRSRS